MTESPNNSMRNEARYAALLSQNGFTAYECHFKALNEKNYYSSPTNVEDYCVCVWRVKAKPTQLFDNTQNPES